MLEITNKGVPSVDGASLKDVHEFALRGTLTLEDGGSGVRDLTDAIKANESRNLLVDLTEVTSMDTAGVAALLEAMMKSIEHGGRLKLVKLQSQPSRAFKAIRHSSLLEVYDDRETALRSDWQAKPVAQTQSAAPEAEAFALREKPPGAPWKLSSRVPDDSSNPLNRQTGRA